MKISECVTHFYNYQGMNVKKNTLRNYEFILNNFQNHFGDIELSSVTSEDIMIFMSEVSDGTKQSTKKLRFTLSKLFLRHEPGDDSKIFGKNQRCRGDEMDRQSARVMQPMAELSTVAWFGCFQRPSSRFNQVVSVSLKKIDT